MVLVILYHSCAFWMGNWFDVISVGIEAPKLSLFSIWLNSFHIYGFTLVSGYLFYYLKYENNKYQKFEPFVLSKVKRLLIPYCFVAILWIVPIAATLYSYTIKDIIIKYVLCTSPNQLWFSWMLFWIFVLVWPISNYLKNDIVAVVVALLSWGIGLVGGMVLSNLFCIWTAFTYIPYFILGIKLREKESLFLNKLPGIMYIIAQIVVFIIWQIFSTKSGLLTKSISLGLGYAVHILGALMAFFCLQWLATKVNWKNNKTFMFLSSRSMPIYLFHQQVIYFTIMWLNGKINPYFNALVNFIVAVAISLLISSVLLKFKTTRLLIGEKQ